MKLRRIIAPLAGLVLLAGCQSGSAAFTVDGRSVSEGELERISTGCAEALGIDAGQINKQAITQMVMNGEVATAVAKHADVSLDDSALRAHLTHDKDAAPLLANSTCSQAVLADARLKKVMEEVGQQKFIEVVQKDVDLKVNPRLGDVDPATGKPLEKSLSELAQPGR